MAAYSRKCFKATDCWDNSFSRLLFNYRGKKGLTNKMLAPYYCSQGSNAVFISIKLQPPFTKKEETVAETTIKLGRFFGLDDETTQMYSNMAPFNEDFFEIVCVL